MPFPLAAALAPCRAGFVGMNVGPIMAVYRWHDWGCSSRGLRVMLQMYVIAWWCQAGVVVPGMTWLASCLHSLVWVPFPGTQAGPALHGPPEEAALSVWSICLLCAHSLVTV